MGSDLAAFGITFAYNIILGFFLCFLFKLLLPYFGWALIPREDLESFQNPLELSDPPIMAPRRLRDVPRWARYIWKLPEHELLLFIGVDRVLVLRFMKSMLKLFTVIMCFGVGILLPVNVYADSFPSDESLDLSDFTILTMANIEIFYREFRHRYLLPFRRAVVLWPMNKSLNSPHAVKNFVQECFPGQIEAIICSTDTRKLQSVIDTRDKITEKLSKAVSDQMGSVAPILHRNVPIVGKRFESIPYYSRLIDKLNESIVEKQRKNGDKRVVGAVVTFKDVSLAAACPNYVSRDVQAVIAPSALDISWDSLALSKNQRDARMLLVSLIVFSLVAFYVIPITFVSSLTSLERLTTTFSFLEPILHVNVALKAFLEGFLPTIALTIFMAILPKLLHVLSCLESHELSNSGFQIGVFEKAFYFQFFNVFLASIVAGSLISVLDEIIRSPGKTIDLLSESLPEYSTFFMSYLMLNTLSGFPMELLSLGKVIGGTLKLRVLATTPSEIAAVKSPEPLELGWHLSYDILVPILGFTYAAISPLILIFVVLYFSVAWTCTAFQLIYVREVHFDGGGLFFPKLHSRLLLGLSVAQLTMVGYFGLKDCPVMASFTIPLVILTYQFYKIYLVANQYDFDNLTKEEAIELNAIDAQIKEQLYRNMRLLVKPINVVEFIAKKRECV